VLEVLVVLELGFLVVLELGFLVVLEERHNVISANMIPD
jgi:hypothetical protein